MNEMQLYRILDRIAVDLAPGEINLWPAIQKHIQRRGQTLPQADAAMDIPLNREGRGIFNRPVRLPRQFRLAIVPFFIMLVVSVIIFSLPSGRVWAQEILHFFNRNESNILPGPSSTPVEWVEQTPGAPVATFTPHPAPAALAFESKCGPIHSPRCSIDAIREIAAFPVFALAEAPPEMNFIGATGEINRVYLVYTTSDQAGYLAIVEEPCQDFSKEPAWEVGADADIQSVQIGAVTAEYVKGAYDGNSNPPVWNPDIDHQILRWVNHNTLFTLYMTGAKPALSRADLVSLAATLTDGNVGIHGAPVTTSAPTAEPFDFHSVYPLSFAEAEEKAGFKLLSPARLPETLSFIGASYQEENHIIMLYYHYNHPNVPEATDGLVVSEQLAEQDSRCDLCGFVQGNGKQVEEFCCGTLISQDAQVESIRLGEIDAQYLEGIGWVSWDDTTGWQWDSSPYRKRLRYQKDGIAIEIWADSFEISKADILAIAENLE